MKSECVKDDSVDKFAQQLEQRDRQKRLAQLEREERVQQQWSPGHYPQLTCDWFVEGLDFCCDYWRYKKNQEVHHSTITTTTQKMAEEEELIKEQLAKIQECLARRRARNTRKKARYRAKYPEKVAAIKKRYREKNREKIVEAQKRYNETHQEKILEKHRHNDKRRVYVQRYYAKHRDQILERQRQRRREKRQTQKKLQALGSKTLRVVLTDYLKSPQPSVDLRTPVATYFESFCQTLDAKGDAVNPLGSKTSPQLVLSFCQSLDAEGDTDSLTLTNLDSGEISSMDQHVWAKDVDQWLDDVMEVLEDPSSLEDRVDVHDLLEDMTPEDWEHVVDDVLDQFDLDLL